MAHKATIREIADSHELFNRFNHWRLGEMVTAIHGRDQSTREKYAAAPEGSVLVTLRAGNFNINRAGGKSRQVMLPGGTEFILLPTS